MAETNGAMAPGLEPAAAPALELDALLSGLFEPTLYTVAPGRTVEIRPLVLSQADALYLGGLKGAELQRYLLARCCYLGGLPIGEAGAARLPVILANRLVPVVMAANGMRTDEGDGDEGGAPVDPLA